MVHATLADRIVRRLPARLIGDKPTSRKDWRDGRVCHFRSSFCTRESTFQRHRLRPRARQLVDAGEHFNCHPERPMTLRTLPSRETLNRRFGYVLSREAVAMQRKR
jgi:hypothetical protein